MTMGPEQSSDGYNNGDEASQIKTRKDIGREVLMQIKNEFDFVTDPEVVTMVNLVGRDLVKAAGGDPDYYHFFVIKENSINAFAVPGGYIFIHDELIRNLNDVDGLAGVLAHEIAHIERDHLFKDSKKTGIADLATLAGILIAVNSGSGEMATAVVAQAANISYKLKMSREHEEDADLFAVKYLKRSEYNPSGLSDLFKAISNFAKHNSSDLPLPYLSTHPGIIERNLIVESLVKDIKFKKKNRYDNLRWERIVTILNAKKTEERKNSADEPSQSDAIKAHIHYLRGLHALKSMDYKEALSEYLEAVRLDDMNPLYHADLADLYQKQDKIELAREEALKSVSLSSEYATPYIVLGMIAKNEGSYEKAIEFFKKAEKLSLYNSYLQYQMAESYNALKMPAAERFHLGRYYRYNLDTENALLQFERGLKESDEEVYKKKLRDEIITLKREGV